MVMGSSGLPNPFISCRSALPMDVTRSVTCRDLPSRSVPVPESTPSQEPARLFSLSKDFCASDFCASDWAKAKVDSDTKTRTESIRRSDFMFHSPYFLYFRLRVTRVRRRGQFQ